MRKFVSVRGERDLQGYWNFEIVQSLTKTSSDLVLEVVAVAVPVFEI